MDQSHSIVMGPPSILNTHSTAAGPPIVKGAHSVVMDQSYSIVMGPSSNLSKYTFHSYLSTFRSQSCIFHTYRCTF